MALELNPLDETYWQNIFNKFDKNKDGAINRIELNNYIKSTEYENEIPDHVVKQLHRQADTDGNGVLDFQEFLAMVNNPKNSSIFMQNVKKGYSNYMRFMLPPKHAQIVGVQRVASQTEVDGRYEDEYSCCPPPVFMIVISLVQIALYCVDEFSGHPTQYAQGDVAVALIYDPHKQKEAWRYISYMCVHIGIFHLAVNLLIQIMLGTTLEMVHKGPRVVLIYLAGVLAGSLGTSITDPHVKLAGASGGVYALITAHIATIILNWSEMSFPLIQLMIFVIVTVADVGTAIYNRYFLDLDEHIGYAAHFFGALAGLLVGIWVLRNIEVTRNEKILKWVAVVVYILLMGSAIIINVFYRSYFPLQYV